MKNFKCRRNNGCLEPFPGFSVMKKYCKSSKKTVYLTQNNYNVSNINQVMSGYIQFLEKEPLSQALIADFQKLSKKNQLKVLAYIQELK